MNPVMLTSPCSQLFYIFCPVSVCLGHAGCKISGARYFYCSLCIIHCMNRQLDTYVLLLQQCGTEVSLVWKMLLLLHIFTSAMHLSCKQKGQLLIQVRHFLRKTVGRMSTHHFVPWNLSKDPVKSFIHLPISRGAVKQEGHGTLEQQDKASCSVCKWMFNLLSLALKLSTSLQGGGIQIQAYLHLKDGKYVLKEWMKEEWISPDIAM